jgi:hypothetical protein
MSRPHSDRAPLSGRASNQRRQDQLRNEIENLPGHVGLLSLGSREPSLNLGSERGRFVISLGARKGFLVSLLWRASRRREVFEKKEP